MSIKHRDVGGTEEEAGGVPFLNLVYRPLSGTEKSTHEVSIVEKCSIKIFKGEETSEASVERHKGD